MQTRKDTTFSHLAIFSVAGWAVCPTLSTPAPLPGWARTAAWSTQTGGDTAL